MKPIENIQITYSVQLKAQRLPFAPSVKDLHQPSFLCNTEPAHTPPRHCLYFSDDIVKVIIPQQKAKCQLLSYGFGKAIRKI